MIGPIFMQLTSFYELHISSYLYFVVLLVWTLDEPIYKRLQLSIVERASFLCVLFLRHHHQFNVISEHWLSDALPNMDDDDIIKVVSWLLSKLKTFCVRVSSDNPVKIFSFSEWLVCVQQPTAVKLTIVVIYRLGLTYHRWRSVSWTCTTGLYTLKSN